MKEDRLTTRDIARNMEAAVGDAKPIVADPADTHALPMFAAD